jgi:hypothetical protein
MQLINRAQHRLSVNLVAARKMQVEGTDAILFRICPTRTVFGCITALFVLSATLLPFATTVVAAQPDYTPIVTGNRPSTNGVDQSVAEMT